MIPGNLNLRDDHWEHDLEFSPLRAACATRGIELTAVIWDDRHLVPEAHDAFVIGTTWDYAERPGQFLATLEEIAVCRPLFNPLSIVRWNLRKTYLRDLAAKGVPVVPTLWRERADLVSINSAFAELDVDEIVVKPVVGASAWRQVRLKRGEPIPPPEELPPHETMIQPFLHASANEGEFSFLFFDRQFSHCARKISRAGDYRVQSMYGGREEIYAASIAEIEQAQEVLDALEWPLLYARVDMMRNANGQLLLMELELIEPYLYPEQGPGFAESFARALAGMLPR